MAPRDPLDRRRCLARPRSRPLAPSLADARRAPPTPQPPFPNRREIRPLRLSPSAWVVAEGARDSYYPRPGVFPDAIARPAPGERRRGAGRTEAPGFAPPLLLLKTPSLSLRSTSSPPSHTQTSTPFFSETNTRRSQQWPSCSPSSPPRPARGTFCFWGELGERARDSRALTIAPLSSQPNQHQHSPSVRCQSAKGAAAAAAAAVVLSAGVSSCATSARESKRRGRAQQNELGISRAGRRAPHSPLGCARSARRSTNLRPARPRGRGWRRLGGAKGRRRAATTRERAEVESRLSSLFSLRRPPPPPPPLRPRDPVPRRPAGAIGAPGPARARIRARGRADLAARTSQLGEEGAPFFRRPPADEMSRATAAAAAADPARSPPPS